jgi:hypothetical protein
LIEINNNSPPENKIALFRSLFRGREDVYAKRFESRKTGKSGYQPACRNEWVKGICEKPRIRCGSCRQRSFELVTDDEDKPWQKKSTILPSINGPLPQKVEIMLADQLYVNHTGLPPVLRNRILRLASFANPEFYKAQKMRLTTWDKPHILYCYEFFREYIGLPVGCLDGLLAIFEHH